MPSSTIVGKSTAAFVLARLQSETPLRLIVDVGPGLGSYKRLIGPLLPGTRWVAIEVWAPYVGAYGLSDLYDRVYVSDVTCFDFSLLPPGGLVILGDVLEHIERNDAIATVSKIMHHMDYAILSVPAGHWPQGEHGGNRYEAHVDSWSLPELQSAFRPWLAGYANHTLNSTQSIANLFLANSPERRAKLATHVAEALALHREKPSFANCDLPFYPDLANDKVIDQFVSVMRQTIGEHAK